MNDDIQIPPMHSNWAGDYFRYTKVVPVVMAESAIRTAVLFDRQNRLTELEQRADEEAEQARVALLDRQRAEPVAWLRSDELRKLGRHGSDKPLYVRSDSMMLHAKGTPEAAKKYGFDVPVFAAPTAAPTDDEIIDLALATEHGGEAGGGEPRLHYFRDSDIVEFALRLLRLNGTAQAQPDHSAGVSKMVGPDDHVERPLDMVEPVAVLRYERGTPGSENEMPTVVSCNWMPDGEYRVYLDHDAAQALPDQFRGATEMIGGNSGELDEREAFEAHFSQPPFEWEFHRYGGDSAWPGNYQNYDYQCAWEAWQARAALAAQASAQDRVDAERYRWLVTHCRTTPEHWGGRWSIVIDGPAPEPPSDKAAIDAAIDAIRAKAGGAA